MIMIPPEVRPFKLGFLQDLTSGFPRPLLKLLPSSMHAHVVVLLNASLASLNPVGEPGKPQERGNR